MLVDLPVEDRYAYLSIVMPHMVNRIREHRTCYMQKRYANKCRVNNVSTKACGYQFSVNPNVALGRMIL